MTIFRLSICLVKVVAEREVCCEEVSGVLGSTESPYLWNVPTAPSTLAN